MTLVTSKSLGSLQTDAGAGTAIGCKQAVTTARLPQAVEGNIRRLLSQKSPGVPPPAAILLSNQLPSLPSGKPDRAAAAQLGIWESVLSGCQGRHREEQHRRSSHVGANEPEIPECVEPSDRKRQRTRTGQGTAAGEDSPSSRSEDDTEGHGIEEPDQGAPVSEARVMCACAEALQGTAMLASLEPNVSLLEIGATSLHILVVASLLRCSMELIYEHPFPRALAHALSLQSTPRAAQQSSRRHRSRPHALDPPPRHVSSGRPSRNGSGEGMCEMHDAGGGAAGTIADALPSEELRGHQGRVQPASIDHRRQRGLGQEGVEVRQGSMGFKGNSSTPVRVHVSDSRGQSACLLMRPGDLPHHPLQEHRGSHSSAACCDGSIIAEMKACVDAPVTLLQYADPQDLQRQHTASQHFEPAPRQYTGSGSPFPKDSGSTCCLGTHQSWLLACSHGGDIACVSIHARDSSEPQPSQEAPLAPKAFCYRRVWTAEVSSSPDAGLQVTGCGRAVAVACLSGNVHVLRLRDGQPVGCLRTGGQLRRYDVACDIQVLSRLPKPRTASMLLATATDTCVGSHECSSEDM